MQLVEDFDVVVIGGGPGGSTTSTVLAMQNQRVLQLERDQFPRYQIGESLLPATIHGVCKCRAQRSAALITGIMSTRWHCTSIFQMIICIRSRST